MKRRIALLIATFLIHLAVCSLAFAQEIEEEVEANDVAEESEELDFSSGGLKLGNTARMGIEVGTEFVWDIENKSVGLESNVGIEFYLPLFSAGEYGYRQSNYMQPGVRLVLKDMRFQWLEAYYAKGGNFKADTVNTWMNRPLVLSYGELTADVVWRNFFLQVAGTTNPMEVNRASLVSIFDEVMDTDDRWYLKKQYALYSKTRYNKLDLPLLGERLTRDYLGDGEDMGTIKTDYKDDISGQLGIGVEFSKFTALAKAASLFNGRDNDNNAWYFGLDASAYPVEEMSIDFSGLVGVNTDKDTKESPAALGLSVDYKIPLTDKMVLKPFAGVDMSIDYDDTDKRNMEIGFGTYLYFRGEDFMAKHRDVDYDEIIPVGVSVSANVCMSPGDTWTNIVISAFELADRKALIPNLGYFLEVEFARIGKNNMKTAVQAQIEYLIKGIFLPYINVKYYPEMSENKRYFTGDTYLEGKIGVYFTPMQLFSLDLWYSNAVRVDKAKGASGNDTGKGTLGFSCVIRL